MIRFALLSVITVFSSDLRAGVVAPSCREAGIDKQVAAMVSRTIEVAKTCAAAIKVPELHEAAEVLRKAEIHCRPDMDIRRDGGAYVRENLVVSKMLTHGYEIFLSEPAYRNFLGLGYSTLLHEALHFTSSNNFPTSIHNDPSRLEPYGGRFADRVELLAEACFKDIAVYSMLIRKPEVCEFAFTSTHSTLRRYLSWGSELADATQYSPRYAKLVCAKIKEYLKDEVARWVNGQDKIRHPGQLPRAKSLRDSPRGAPTRSIPVGFALWASS